MTPCVVRDRPHGVCVHCCCSCRFEFHAAAPLLIVAPAAQLAQWEAEWKFWAGGRSEGGAEASSSSPCNVVVYSGCTAARTIIHDNELWLSPSSLDNKHKVRVRC